MNACIVLTVNEYKYHTHFSNYACGQIPYMHHKHAFQIMMSAQHVACTVTTHFGLYANGQTYSAVSIQSAQSKLCSSNSGMTEASVSHAHLKQDFTLHSWCRRTWASRSTLMLCESSPPQQLQCHLLAQGQRRRKTKSRRRTRKQKAARQVLQWSTLHFAYGRTTGMILGCDLMPELTEQVACQPTHDTVYHYMLCKQCVVCYSACSEVACPSHLVVSSPAAVTAV